MGAGVGDSAHLAHNGSSVAGPFEPTLMEPAAMTVSLGRHVEIGPKGTIQSGNLVALLVAGQVQSQAIANLKCDATGFHASISLLPAGLQFAV